MKTYAMLMTSLCGLLCAAEEVTQQSCTQQPEKASKMQCVVRQGDPLNDSYKGAYNLPAAPAVSHKMCGCGSDWTFSIMAAATYKYVSEEGLRVAVNGVYDGGDVHSPVDSKGVFPDFHYVPGFKVGLGVVDNDEWAYNATYSWLHTNRSNSFSSTGLTTTEIDGTTGTEAGLVAAPWFQYNNPSGNTDIAGGLNAKWDLTLQTIDLTVGRPFYQGKRLTVTPMAGLEVILLHQNMHVTITEDRSLAPLSSPLLSKTVANSWSIGPVCGGQAKHLLSYGFYATGAGSVGLGYTSYTTLKHSEDTGSVNTYHSRYKHYHAMRPNANMELGLGWAGYAAGNGCYIDVFATYDFAIYWAQNMLTKLANDFNSSSANVFSTSYAAEDLYTQGLSGGLSIAF